MKKRGTKQITAKTKNKTLIAIFFTAGYISLEILESNLTNHILGICFFIAAIYGVVCQAKDVKFLF